MSESTTTVVVQRGAAVDLRVSAPVFSVDAGTRRHLRSCTIDRDQVHIRLRRLRPLWERRPPGSVCPPLAGSSR